MMSPNHYSSADSSDMELSDVALGVLALYAALIGAALGSLLPRPFGGVTLGCGVAISFMTVLPGKSGGVGVWGDFVLWGPVLALLGGALATW